VMESVEDYSRRPHHTNLQSLKKVCRSGSERQSR
jgi:hypothetical protein